jgi:hypothetical protein
MFRTVLSDTRVNVVPVLLQNNPYEHVCDTCNSSGPNLRECEGSGLKNASPVTCADVA